MKLRTKLLLLMGLTTFLVLASVLLTALVYMTSTLNEIRHEARKYAVEDMQNRAKISLLRFRDTLTGAFSRAATFYASMKLSKEDMIRVLETRFEHAYGTDSILFGDYHAAGANVAFSNLYGLVMDDERKKKTLNDFPAFFPRTQLDEILLKNGSEPITLFAVAKDENCWIIHRAVGEKEKTGRFFAVRFSPQYLNGMALGLNSGLLVLRENHVLLENFKGFGGKLPEKVRDELPKLAESLPRGRTDKIVWQTFLGADGEPMYLACAISLNPGREKMEIQLVRVYEYEHVMPTVTKLLDRQIPNLAYFVVIFLLAGLILLSIPLIYFSKQLTVPIGQAAAFANTLASGDFTAREQHECGIHEIDMLITSLNHMRDRLTALIGKLKRSHAREQEARKDAENVNHLKSDFLDAMSQEYLEPLNSLHSFADLLEYRTKSSESIPSDELLTVVRAIHVSLCSLTDMGKTMRELAEIDMPGSVTVSPEDTDIYEIFHELNEPFIQEAKNRSVELEFRYGTDIPSILVIDRKLFSRMITALMTAVCKSTPPGAHVTVSCFQSDKRLVLSCAGGGENPAPLEYLLYNTSKRPLRTYESSESIIHLTIARKLAHTLGADFDVTCPEGKNYDVRISFAISEITGNFTSTDTGKFLREVAETSALRTSSGHRTSARARTGSRILMNIRQQGATPLRVLVSEDDESNRILLRMMLRGIHCEVTEVSNLRDTRTELSRRPPDVFILDLHMRELERFPFLSEVRSAPNAKNIYIIVLSAYLEDGDCDRLISAGANRCLLKPIRIDELTEAVHASMSLPRK